MTLHTHTHTHTHTLIYIYNSLYKLLYNFNVHVGNICRSASLYVRISVNRALDMAILFLFYYTVIYNSIYDKIYIH